MRENSYFLPTKATPMKYLAYLGSFLPLFYMQNLTNYVVAEMSDEIRALEKAYPPFQRRLTFKDFVTKVSSLPIDKWNFVRASLLYQQALKCKGCEPNIAMALLCSCAEALKVAGKKKGSHKNFISFYLTYCPSALGVPPLEYYPNAKPPAKTAPFDEALDFVYAKFRCLYIHEGKARLAPVPKGIGVFGSFLLDKFDKEYYRVDTIKLHGWFEKITLESLCNML